MQSRQVVVANPSGLHARPAALLVQAAQGFESSVQVGAADRVADAKSILDVLTLGVEQGAAITLTVEGADELTAIEALSGLVENGLGEAPHDPD